MYQNSEYIDARSQAAITSHKTPHCRYNQYSSLMNNLLHNLNAFHFVDHRPKPQISTTTNTTESSRLTANIFRQQATSAQESASLLLCLPGELRNKIWELALTSSDPLHHRWPARPKPDYSDCQYRLVEKKEILKFSHPVRPCFNRLKGVCKQLRYETEDL